MSNNMNNKMFNKISGDSGERKAREYLKKQGYRIIKCNYSNKIGEIDIIAYDQGVLVFVEVKYRKDDYFGLPREAVNYNKQRKIRQVATVYINQNELFDKVIRFDVVEILGDQVELIKNCF